MENTAIKRLTVTLKYNKCIILASINVLQLAGAVVVAQLVERSLPTPEIRGSNPDIGNISNVKFIFQLLSRKDENKEKEAH